MKKAYRKSTYITLSIVGSIALLCVLFLLLVTNDKLAGLTEKAKAAAASGWQLSLDDDKSFGSSAYMEIRQISSTSARVLQDMNTIYDKCDGGWYCKNQWLAESTLSTYVGSSGYAEADELLKKPTTVCNIRRFHATEHQALCIEKASNKLLIYRVKD